MSCEKCWWDAFDPSGYKDQVDEYRRLLDLRKDNPCTPKEQAGQWWDEENQRDSRFRVMAYINAHSQNSDKGA